MERNLLRVGLLGYRAIGQDVVRLIAQRPTLLIDLASTYSQQKEIREACR